MLAQGVGTDSWRGLESHLDARAPALAHGIRDGGSGRVDHRHEADKAQVVRREVQLLGIEWKTDGKLVDWEAKVTET